MIKNSILLPSNKAKLLYHINKITGNLRLYILPVVAPNILQIVYREGYLVFSYCYKIVTRSWYIWGLIKLLKKLIWYCL